MNDLKEISEIIKQSDDILWNVYTCSKDSSFNKLKSNLIYPRTRNFIVRVSEQEARAIFSNQLTKSKNNYLYSLETPTILRYKLTGQKERKALTDLTIYSNSGEILFSVEFKNGTITPSAKSSFPIEKDILKILLEDSNCIWFHTLESTDNSTINNVLEVIKHNLKDAYIKNQSEIKDKKILFHLIILKHGFSLTKILDISNTFKVENLDEFFNIKYKVSRSNLKSIKNNHWTINALDLSII